MAPTEILAKQHYQSFIETLAKYGLNIQFIAGSTTKKQKEDIVRQMKTGTVDIIIGTHALIQEGIGFKNLGLAIIDEQHRFGVAQRQILKDGHRHHDPQDLATAQPSCPLPVPYFACWPHDSSLHSARACLYKGNEHVHHQATQLYPHQSPAQHSLSHTVSHPFHILS